MASELKEAMKKNPLPDCLKQFSEGSAYDKVPEGEQTFDIPKRGTKEYKVLKELAPETFRKELEKQEKEGKPPDEGGGSVVSSKPSKVSAKSKKSQSLHSVRRSERIAQKKTVPGAPSKGKDTDEDTTGDEEVDPGVHALISDLKDYREKIDVLLSRLDKGKYFTGDILHATLDEVQEAYYEVVDTISTIKASLLELAEICEGVIYQRVSDEFRMTYGQRLREWEFTLKQWMNKKKNPDADTPTIEMVGETPGVRRWSSSEETHTRAYLKKLRGTIPPKTPPDFDAVDSDRERSEGEEGDKTPVGRFIREGDFLLDTAKKRTAKKKTPDPRMGNCSGNPPQDAADITGKTDATEATIQGESVSPEVVVIDAGKEDEAAKNSEEVFHEEERVDKHVPADETRAPEEVRVENKEKVEDTEVPKTVRKTRATDTRTKEPEKVTPVLPEHSELGEKIRTGTLSAIGRTIEENARKLNEERYREQQERKKRAEIRRYQQHRQMKSVLLYDLSPEETKRVRELIKELGEANEWHPDDIHRLIGKFMTQSRFPAEFESHEYVQQFLKPKMDFAGAVGKGAQPKPKDVLPKFSDIPKEKIRPDESKKTEEVLIATSGTTGTGIGEVERTGVRDEVLKGTESTETSKETSKVRLD